MRGFDGGPGCGARLTCINCGGPLSGVRCKLVCVRECGYFESCSDLEPAPPFVFVDEPDR